MALTLGKQSQANLAVARQTLRARVQTLFDTFWVAQYQPVINSAIAQLQASVEFDFTPTVPNNVLLPNWLEAIDAVLRAQDFTVYPPNPTLDPVTRQPIPPAPGRRIVNWDTPSV